MIEPPADDRPDAVSRKRSRSPDDATSADAPPSKKLSQQIHGRPLLIHEALAQENPSKILALRRQGVKANQLDADHRSPLQRLDGMTRLETTERRTLRQALLTSINPNAPLGHQKWEAGHGSPWGLEILLSGALRGGLNDAKGGSHSLDGKVFFSDRTPLTDDAKTTRPNLRQKARAYANGEGVRESTASVRALTHKWLQTLGGRIAAGDTLSMTAGAMVLEIDRDRPLTERMSVWLHHWLSRDAGVFFRFEEEDAANMWLRPHFPARLDVHDKETGLERTIEGAELHRLYTEVIAHARQQLEDGKAPYLAMLNEGKVIPLVFGFSHIEDLKTHRVPPLNNQGEHRYAYQDDDHPLTGSAKGGQLLEVETRDLRDLATLALGMRIKGADLPAETDTVIRLRAPRDPQTRQKTEKAGYLDREAFARFRERLDRWLEDRGASGNLSEQPLDRLQALNRALRDAPLATWSRPTAQPPDT